MVLTWLTPRVLGRRIFFELDSNAPTHIILDWLAEDNNIIVQVACLRLVISKEVERGNNVKKDRQTINAP